MNKSTKREIQSLYPWKTGRGPYADMEISLLGFRFPKPEVSVWEDLFSKNLWAPWTWGALMWGICSQEYESQDTKLGVPTVTRG